MVYKNQKIQLEKDTPDKKRMRSGTEWEGNP